MNSFSNYTFSFRLQIKEKRKRFDNKRLSSFGCNKDVLKNCNTTPTRPSTSESVSTHMNDLIHSQPMGYSTPLGHSQSVRNSTPLSRSKPLVSTIHRSRKPEVPKLFLGTMYRYSCYDECVQELLPDTGVYLNKQEYENIKCIASSASAMARQLMKAIFSDEALVECSLGGNIAFGQGRLNEVADTRPALDRQGVDAIFSYVRARQRKKVEQKRWKELDDTTIKTRMRNLLCEHRFRKKHQNTTRSLV